MIWFLAFGVTLLTIVLSIKRLKLSEDNAKKSQDFDKLRFLFDRFSEVKEKTLGYNRLKDNVNFIWIVLRDKTYKYTSNISTLKSMSKPTSSSLSNDVTKSTIKTTSTTKSSSSPVATQCTGTTQKGARCKRKTKNSSGRCYQH